MFFFFKQKTAYDILSGPVGSEMFIRDRPLYSSNNTLKVVVVDVVEKKKKKNILVAYFCPLSNFCFEQFSQKCLF